MESKGFSYSAYKDIVNGEGKVFDDQNNLSKIKLYPEQIVHMKKLVDSAKKHDIIFDQSDMGSGKTVVSLAQLKWWGYNGLIICPNSAKAVWRKHIDQYDVFNVVYKKSKGKEVPKQKDIEIYNFELLSRGTSFPYLKKLVKTEGKNKIEAFEPTEELDNLIANQNTFLIIDEAHSLKNTTSSRSQAAITFINECTALAEKHKTKFKVLLCSGTLFDKPEHTKTFLKMMKILKSRNLFYTDPMTLSVKLEGLQEVIDAAKSINARKTQEVLSMYPFDTSQKSKSADNICYELFVKVILDDHSSSMGTQKTNHDAKQQLINIYLNLSDENYEYYSRGISMLSESVARMARARMAGVRFENVWGGVMKSLQILESSKCTSLAIHCYQKLKENPNLKIVIGCWFVHSIKYLEDSLKDFGAMTLTGALKESDRAKIIDLFQKDNDKCRVIIGQMSIISQSISLDDTTGNYSREAYFIPNYQAVPLQQAAGRIHRKNTMSDSTVYYVYGKQFSTTKNAPINTIGTEMQLLSTLVVKGETLKSINKAQVQTGKKFLDDNENLMDTISMDKYNVIMSKYKIQNLDIEKAIEPKPKEEKEEMMEIPYEEDGSKSPRGMASESGARSMSERPKSRISATTSTSTRTPVPKKSQKIEEAKSERIKPQIKPKIKSANYDDSESESETESDDLTEHMKSMSMKDSDVESESEENYGAGVKTKKEEPKSSRTTKNTKTKKKAYARADSESSSDEDDDSEDFTKKRRSFESEPESESDEKPKRMIRSR